jgi:hypothetical protein
VVRVARNSVRDRSLCLLRVPIVVPRIHQGVVRQNRHRHPGGDRRIRRPRLAEAHYTHRRAGAGRQGLPVWELRTHRRQGVVHQSHRQPGAVRLVLDRLVRGLR